MFHGIPVLICYQKGSSRCGFPAENSSLLFPMRPQAQFMPNRLHVPTHNSWAISPIHEPEGCSQIKICNPVKAGSRSSSFLFLQKPHPSLPPGYTFNNSRQRRGFSVLSCKKTATQSFDRAALSTTPGNAGSSPFFRVKRLQPSLSTGLLFQQLPATPGGSSFLLKKRLQPSLSTGLQNQERR